MHKRASSDILRHTRVHQDEKVYRDLIAHQCDVIAGLLTLVVKDGSGRSLPGLRSIDAIESYVERSSLNVNDLECCAILLRTIDMIVCRQSMNEYDVSETLGISQTIKELKKRSHE